MTHRVDPGLEVRSRMRWIGLRWLVTGSSELSAALYPPTSVDAMCASH